MVVLFVFMGMWRVGVVAFFFWFLLFFCFQVVCRFDMGVLPVSAVASLCEMSALVVARSIHFDVDNICGLGLSDELNEVVFDFIRLRSVCSDDVLFWVGRNRSVKRKIVALRGELGLKFACVSCGDWIPLETVYRC